MKIQTRENVFDVLVQMELLLALIIVKTGPENIVKHVTQATSFHTVIKQKVDALIGNVLVKMELLQLTPTDVTQMELLCAAVVILDIIYQPMVLLVWITFVLVQTVSPHQIFEVTAPFMDQRFASVATLDTIYLPILAITAWLINTNPGWGYQPTVIFDNLEFNIAIGLIGFTGLASLALSYKPDCIKICLGANELKNKR